MQFQVTRERLSTHNKTTSTFSLLPFFAVTSISIFISSSISPACIIVAAGLVSPNQARNTGQAGSKSRLSGKMYRIRTISDTVVPAACKAVVILRVHCSVCAVREEGRVEVW